MIVTQTLQTLLPNMIVYTSPKNFNGELGMSLSIFEIEKYTPSMWGMIYVLGLAVKKLVMSSKQTFITKVLVLEYGIDHPGEMAFLISIVAPDISIHTQIDAVHSLQF
jgi:UDP-N-acetylmuramyl pentapeptide synthase